jgi:hypothetical protein
VFARGTGGAWEELVPGTETRPLPIDRQPEDRRRCRVGTILVAVHRLGQLGIERGGNALVGLVRGTFLRRGGPQGRYGCRQALRVARRGLLDARLDQEGPFGQLERDVVAGVVLLDQIAAPGGEAIGPRLDRVLVAADALDREGALPPIVADMGQRSLRPAAPGAPIPDDGSELGGPVPEDVGRDGETVPDDGLSPVPTTVHHRVDLLDHDRTASGCRSGFRRH